LFKKVPKRVPCRKEFIRIPELSFDLLDFLSGGGRWGITISAETLLVFLATLVLGLDWPGLATEFVRPTALYVVLVVFRPGRM
jgi:hypothetical protein